MMQFRKHKFIFSFVVLIFSCISAKAQTYTDTVINNNTIQIIQAYKPVVKAISKIEFHPQQAIVDSDFRIGLYYKVPQQQLLYTYKSVPINPLALGKELKGTALPNFVSLGIGNYRNIQLQASLFNDHSKHIEQSLYVFFNQQRGSLSLQQYNDASIFYHLMRVKAHWNYYLDANVERNNFYYFGADSIAQKSADELHQNVIKISTILAARNTTKDKFGLYYKPSIAFSNLHSIEKANEFNVGLTLPAIYELRPNSKVIASLVSNLSLYHTDSISKNNNYTQLQLAYQATFKKLKVDFGLAPTIASKGFVCLPIISVLWNTIYKVPIQVFFEHKGAVLANNLNNLFAENKYIQFTQFNYFQSVKTATKLQVDASIGNHFSAGIVIAHESYDQFAYFIKDTVSKINFNVAAMQNLKNLLLMAHFNYQVTKSLQVINELKKYNYTSISGASLVNMPSFSFHSHIIIQALKKLYIDAGMNVLAGQTTKIGLIESKMDPFIDLSGLVQYNFKPKIDFQLKFNNLLNNTNPRWYGYSNFGTNFVAVISYKFK
jgi:hypothetical protein